MLVVCDKISDFWFSLPNNLFCMNNIGRIYLLINWLGMKGLRAREGSESTCGDFIGLETSENTSKPKKFVKTLHENSLKML